MTVGRLVRLMAKPGEEAEVISLLEEVGRGGGGTGNHRWFAISLGLSQFGSFDASPDDAGCQAHLGGQVAVAVMAQAPDLLTQPPVIEPVDVLAAKLPGSWQLELGGTPVPSDNPSACLHWLSERP